MSNTFQKGSGRFHCEACGRSTRHTGEQAVGSMLCPNCWDIAGIYNEYQDEGDEAIERNAKYIIDHCDTITMKGGKLDGDAEELLDLANAYTTA